MNQTFSAGGVIVNKNNEVLLIDEGDGFWGLPKGRIEDGENILATALREIKEETGFTNLKLIKKLGSYQRHPVIEHVEDVNELKNITLFLFQVDEDISSSNYENNECAWFTIQQATKKMSHLKDKEFFINTVVDPT